MESPAEEQQQAQPVPDVVDVLLFIGLAFPLFLIVFFVAAAALKIAHVNGAGVKILLPQVAGYLAAMIPLYLVFRTRYDESPMRLLRMGVNVKDAGTSISLGILTAFAVTGIAALLQTPHPKMPMDELLSDTASIIAAAIVGVTLAPWFEELLFRGLLQPLLGRYAGVAAGVAVSAFLFALLHGPQYGWSWRHVLLITCAGAAFGIRRAVTKSTGAAVVMHAAYNSVLFAAFFAGKWAGSNLPKTI